MSQPRPHISPDAAETAFDPKPLKRRGSYNCGRCGQPKRGHNCHLAPIGSTPADSTVPSSSSAVRSRSPQGRQPCSNLRRALSFDDIDLRCDSPEREVDWSVPGSLCLDLDKDLGTGWGGLPTMCLWEVLRRLQPPGLLAAARVCKGWRETSRRLWKAAEELRLRVPAGTQLGSVGSMLKKCPGLVRLSLRMERFEY